MYAMAQGEGVLTFSRQEGAIRDRCTLICALWMGAGRGNDVSCSGCVDYGDMRGYALTMRGVCAKVRLERAGKRNAGLSGFAAVVD